MSMAQVIPLQRTPFYRGFKSLTSTPLTEKQITALEDIMFSLLRAELSEEELREAWQLLQDAADRSALTANGGGA